jgi:hypothetical protein
VAFALASLSLCRSLVENRLEEDFMLRIRTRWKLALALVTAAGAACPTALSGAAPTPAAATPASAAGDEAATKKKILESPAWQQAMQGYHEWLSVQVIYDPQQVAQIKAQLTEKVHKMTAPQLAAFLEDLQKKLAILGSKEALEARAWAESYLNTLSTAYAEKFRSKFPDVANMTAAQVQQGLYDLQQRRNLQAANQRAFDEARDQQVAAIREMNRQAAEASAAAQAQSSYSSGSPFPANSAGAYAPLKYSNPQYSPTLPGWNRGWYGGWRW